MRGRERDMKAQIDNRRNREEKVECVSKEMLEGEKEKEREGENERERKKERESERERERERERE